jgi:chemotaxis signal transduction protein
VEPPPEMATRGVETRYIEGVAMLSERSSLGEDHLLIILDTNKIFSEAETRTFQNMTTS